MKSTATNPGQYLAEVPQDRQEILQTVRDVVLRNLPDGYEEAMNYGMIVYQVPLAVYPDTYNKKPLMYAALANQKNYMAIYLMCAYGNSALKQKLIDAYKQAGIKLNMGGSCLRFTKLEDVLLDAIAEQISAVPVNTFIEIAKASRKK